MAYTNFYPKTGVSGNAGTSGKPGYSGDIGINYIDYLAEKLNDSVKYTKHISNSINNSVNYSDFLSLNGIQMKDPIKTCKVIPNVFEQPKNENIGWWCEKNKTSDDFWKYKL